MEKQSNVFLGVILMLMSLNMSACQDGGTMAPNNPIPDMSDTSKLVKLEAVLYSGMPNPAAYLDDSTIAVISEIINREPAASPTATIPDKLGYNGFSLTDMAKARIAGNDLVRVYNQLVVTRSGDQVKNFTDTGRVLEKKLFDIIKPTLSPDDANYIVGELVK